MDRADPQPLLELAVPALAEILAGAEAERVLTRVLRAHPQLVQDERRLLALWLLGTACLRGRLAYRLRNAGLPDDAAHLLLAYRVLEQNAALADPAAQRLRETPVAWPRDPIEHLMAEGSLPRWLAELWIREHGLERAQMLAQAANTPGPTTLRANALRTTREALAAALEQEGIATVPARLAPHGLHVVGRANLWGSRAWRAGLFEVQDEGSQLIAEACHAAPGERWLDLCAGAGGKTLALAAAMRDQGEIVACDVDAKRLENLRARLQRAGVKGVRVVQLEAGREREALGQERFDGVLVDAPCSELGTLRRHPDLRWRLEPAAFDRFPPLQARLLELGAERLRPGGKLVYATCTLRQAENEEVARACGLGLLERTLWPNRHGTDGFFVAATPGCERALPEE